MFVAVGLGRTVGWVGEQVLVNSSSEVPSQVHGFDLHVTQWIIVGRVCVWWLVLSFVRMGCAVVRRMSVAPEGGMGAFVLCASNMYVAQVVVLHSGQEGGIAGGRCGAFRHEKQRVGRPGMCSYCWSHCVHAR